MALFCCFASLKGLYQQHIFVFMLINGFRIISILATFQIFQLNMKYMTWVLSTLVLYIYFFCFYYLKPAIGPRPTGIRKQSTVVHTINAPCNLHLVIKTLYSVSFAGSIKHKSIQKKNQELGKAVVPACFFSSCSSLTIFFQKQCLLQRCFTCSMGNFFVSGRNR